MIKSSLQLCFKACFPDLIKQFQKNFTFQHDTRSFQKDVSIPQSKNISAVCGNIGVGKTTLCSKLAKSLPNSVAAYEEFEDNKYLPLFYARLQKHGMVYNKYTYPMQMTFLEGRLEREENCSEKNTCYIIDRGIVEDRYVFAQSYMNSGLMNSKEAEDYKLMFDKLYRRISKPEVFVYLRADIDILHDRYL